MNALAWHLIMRRVLETAGENLCQSQTAQIPPEIVGRSRLWYRLLPDSPAFKLPGRMRLKVSGCHECSSKKR